MDELQIEDYPEIGVTYKHYKGGKYKVLALAEHTETKEKLVIYKSLNFGTVHARPVKQFFEVIQEFPGIGVKKRFTKI